MVSASPALSTLCHAAPTSAKHDEQAQFFDLHDRLVVCDEQLISLGKPKAYSAIEYELIHYCAAADESASDRFWWHGNAATAAAAVRGAEEWVGQVSEFDLMANCSVMMIPLIAASFHDTLLIDFMENIHIRRPNEWRCNCHPADRSLSHLDSSR